MGSSKHLDPGIIRLMHIWLSMDLLKVRMKQSYVLKLDKEAKYMYSLYVDEMSVTGNGDVMIKEFKEEMERTFDMFH